HFRAGHRRGAVGLQVRDAQPQPERLVPSLRAAGLRGRNQYGGCLQAVPT
ncbi:hypothetical protein KR067_011412, partial [Drosophila pandora]